MKVRAGFVSNSSSTSFCIYGVFIESTEDLHKALGVKEDDDNDVYDEVEEILNKEGLAVYYNEDGSAYVGNEWMNIGDNQTGKQFKKDTEASLKKVGITEKCESFNDTVYV